MYWNRAVLGLAIAIPLVLASCQAPSKVRVTMDEYRISPNVTSIGAGRVTFEVTNLGREEHEMVVLKTDLPTSTLRLRATDTEKVDEEASGTMIGEIEDILVGSTRTETFDLSPGRYILVCNIAGHYGHGMVTTFQAT